MRVFSAAISIALFFVGEVFAQVDEQAAAEAAAAEEAVADSLLSAIIVAVVGGFVIVLIFRYWRSRLGNESNRLREEKEKEWREIADARLQGVLTIQVVVEPSVQQVLESTLSANGTGPDEVANLSTVLRQQREQWQFVAARGTVMMAEKEAIAESQRLLELFQNRLSSLGDGQPSRLALLTATVRAPFDFSTVMPGDVSGFEAAISKLYEMHARDSCGYITQWSEVVPEGLDDLIPGLLPVTG